MSFSLTVLESFLTKMWQLSLLSQMRKKTMTGVEGSLGSQALVMLNMDEQNECFNCHLFFENAGLLFTANQVLDKPEDLQRQHTWLSESAKHPRNREASERPDLVDAPAHHLAGVDALDPRQQLTVLLPAKRQSPVRLIAQSRHEQ